jgi:arsenite methyltransferase
VLVMKARSEADMTAEVRDAYSAAARDPTGRHPFPLGRRFAEELGYPPEVLASIPAVSLEAFTGVSNVSIFAELPAGAWVLDLGCGAGLDSIVAARRVGASGTVVGVDFSRAMLARAHRAVTAASLANVEFVDAGAHEMPFGDACFDVALVNGVFNLNPLREPMFTELARVVRPGGVAYGAELILRDPLAPDACESRSDWFA